MEATKALAHNIVESLFEGANTTSEDCQVSHYIVSSCFYEFRLNSREILARR